MRYSIWSSFPSSSQLMAGLEVDVHPRSAGIFRFTQRGLLAIRFRVQIWWLASLITHATKLPSKQTVSFISLNYLQQRSQSISTGARINDVAIIAHIAFSFHM